MRPTIRTATAHDYTKIAEILDQPAVVEQTSLHPYMGLDKVSQLFEKRADQQILLVGEFEETIEGYLSIHLNPKPRSKHIASIGMAVHPRKKSMGLGKALLSEAIHIADSALNIVRLELDVFTDNDIAINLYKKAGFRIEGEREYCGFKNGNYVGTYMMARINKALLPASHNQSDNISTLSNAK